MVPAGAAAARPVVEVIEVSGRIDPVLTDFVKHSLRRANDHRAVALVMQLNSPGALVSEAELDVLAFRIVHSSVPVAVWVGPSGAQARGGALRLPRAAAIVAVAPGAHAPGLKGGLRSPTLGDFIVALDGRTVDGQKLDTAQVVRSANGPRLRPTVDVEFAKPALLPRLLHTVASPAVGYLLLVIALLLMVFEFFTIGVGVAAACGAGALVLAAYGLAVLPTRPARPMRLHVALRKQGIVGQQVPGRVRHGANCSRKSKV